MASVFVEYVSDPDSPGYNNGPLNVRVQGYGELEFLPKERFGDRRVEELRTEEAALALCNRYRRQGLFQIANDLIASVDLDNIEVYLKGRLTGLLDRVEALEEQVALLNHRQTGKHKK